MAEYDLVDIQELYKDSRYMRDDGYLVNLDYVTHFASKIPQKIRIWKTMGRIPTYEVVEATPDSKECKALVEDARKRVRVEICSNKMTKKNWDEAVSLIKSTLRNYSEEYGRVCIRDIVATSEVVGSLKTLSITVYYGHYVYELAED